MVTIAGGVLLAPTSEKFAGDEVAAEVVLHRVLRCPEVGIELKVALVFEHLPSLSPSLSLARSRALSLPS